MLEFMFCPTYEALCLGSRQPTFLHTCFGLGVQRNFALLRSLEFIVGTYRQEQGVVVARTGCFFSALSGE